MSDQKQATTAHGTVEYETVTCSSCDVDVVRADAKRFVIGEMKKSRNRSYKGIQEFHFDSREYATGWACPHCQDTTVVGFPPSSASWRLWRTIPEGDRLILLITGVMMATLMIAVVLGAVLL